MESCQKSKMGLYTLLKCERIPVWLEKSLLLINLSREYD